MKFIEIVEGFAINKDEIVSLKDLGHDVVFIETETREYTVPANYLMLLNALDEDEAKARNLEAMTKQFFGG
jgi:hypothetical protein